MGHPGFYARSARPAVSSHLKNGSVQDDNGVVLYPKFNNLTA